MELCKKLPYCNRRIDDCLKSKVESINNDGILKTVLSCCGHDKYPATIIVRNKKEEIFEFFSGFKIEKRKRNRYYKRDDEGFYFIGQMSSLYINTNF